LPTSQTISPPVLLSGFTQDVSTTLYRRTSHEIKIGTKKFHFRCSYVSNETKTKQIKQLRNSGMFRKYCLRLISTFICMLKNCKC